MRNAWLTNEGAAAAQALNQEAGDVHAPSLGEKSTSVTELQPASGLFSQHKDPEDMAPSIVVHHERTSVLIQSSPARFDIPQHGSIRPP